MSGEASVGAGGQGPPPRRRLQPSEKQLKQQTSKQATKSFSSSSTTIMAGLYDLEETLGKGHFATVKAAKHVFTGERVAVKVIDKTKLDTVSQKALLKEVLCLKLVQHPNVVKLYEVIDTSSKMYLVLELGQGDLYDLILRHQGGFKEPEARELFAQILTAVSYCHKLHVAHRDLKPENVIFFPPPAKSKPGTSLLGCVKLTDFGFSNKFCPGVNLDTSCGSLAYSAPEILLGDSYDAPAVDIWSLGVILYMLVCGRAPFCEANDSETLTMIMDVKYSIPDHLSPELKCLIRSMLVRDPNKRATLCSISSHPWLQGSCVSSPSLPLIASSHISEAEQKSIFREMVAGGVVKDTEEVNNSLGHNAYNHVTSTYYLLAERLLRDKARNRGVRTPTISPTPPSPTTTVSPQSTSPPIRIRKNSHQFEDVVLPSTNPQPAPPIQKKQTRSVDVLDLETSRSSSSTSSTHGLFNLPVIERSSEESRPGNSRNTSPHHPHYYHHVVRSGEQPQTSSLETNVITRTSPLAMPESSDLASESNEFSVYSASPPKHCSADKLPRSNASDSSDEGGGGGCRSLPRSHDNQPRINIEVCEDTNDSEDKSSSSGGGGGGACGSSNNNNLRPSPSYEVLEEKFECKRKKKRVLFLSWFFKKSDKGEKSSSSSVTKSNSSRNIYKTKSCSELKSRSCNETLHTKESFGLCNGKFN